MSTTITADRVPGWDDRRDQVLSTVIITSSRTHSGTSSKEAKGGRGHGRVRVVATALNLLSSVLPCEAFALCASTLMRKAGPLATAMVPPVRRQLLAASRSAAPRRRWTSWKSGAGGGTRSALGKQHRKLQQGFVAVYAVARTTAPIVASEPARARSSGRNGSSSEQLFSYLSSSESEAVFTADQLQRLRERRGVVGAPPPPP
jgi:hypothetical protein